MVKFGPAATEREQLRTRYREAFLADVTQGLVDEYVGTFRATLGRLRDDPKAAAADGADPDQVRRRYLAGYLALRFLPREDSQLLRLMHVLSLVQSRAITSELELPFV